MISVIIIYDIIKISPLFKSRVEVVLRELLADERLNLPLKDCWFYAFKEYKNARSCQWFCLFSNRLSKEVLATCRSL